MRVYLVVLPAMCSLPVVEEMHEAGKLASSNVDEACELLSASRRDELTWSKVQSMVGGLGDSVLDAGVKELASETGSERNLELSVWLEAADAWSRKRCPGAASLVEILVVEEMREAGKLASSHVAEACELLSASRREELTWSKVQSMVGGLGDSVLDAGLKELASETGGERILELSVWLEAADAWSRQRCPGAASLVEIPVVEEMHEAGKLASSNIDEACELLSASHREELTWSKVQSMVGGLGDSVLDAGLKELASETGSERNLELSIWLEAADAWSRKRCPSPGVGSLLSRGLRSQLSGSRPLAS
eukprot:CAMPEP_0204314008 /NCGR_PEP_ID=MMETSP0469-20131031/3947_1 /ASSEMBLY_ACC=CAM_ASM_000384 /TAXON_ID=2969 /ORGANISM="Oxyrrhis marina" /LENGTH=306 /DNA_ID=CAMNT_0051294425 /DNA_START=67 /DNA_END=987 /DNA_ORIENTATION=+